jgi:hypothetical protein
MGRPYGRLRPSGVRDDAGFALGAAMREDPSVNDAQRALLARLRELVTETPASGALNAGNRPYHPTRFAQAVERRSEDGAALVKYMRTKVHGAATDGVDPLVEAGRADLTVEALVADADAPWASEFDDDDRRAAAQRLEAMTEATDARRAAVESDAVDGDRKVVALMNKRRKDEGKAPLTSDQEAQILARRAAQRPAGS